MDWDSDFYTKARSYTQTRVGVMDFSFVPFIFIKLNFLYDYVGADQIHRR